MAERAKITVALDSEEAAWAISQQVTAQHVQVDVLVEIDVGYRRCVLSNEPELLTLVQKITDLHGLEFCSLMFFLKQFVVGSKVRTVLLEEVNKRLGRTLEALDRAGLPIPTVSGGSTPTAYTSLLFPG